MNRIAYMRYKLVQNIELITTAINITRPNRFMGFLPTISEYRGKKNDPIKVPSKKELPIQLISALVLQYRSS
jgi:hypothetical protein